MGNIFGNCVKQHFDVEEMQPMEGSWRLALENSLILENIAMKCEYSDLRNFRQVCRSWYIASLNRWQKESVVVLHGNLHGYDKNACNKDPSDLPKLGTSNYQSEATHSREILGLSTELSYRKFKIRCGYLIHSEDDLPFWQQFGPQMTYLHITNCIYDKKVLRFILFENSKILETIVIANYLPHPRKESLLNFMGERYITQAYNSLQLTTVKKLVFKGMFSEKIKKNLYQKCPNVKSLTVNRYNHWDFVKEFSYLIPTTSEHLGLLTSINILKSHDEIRSRKCLQYISAVNFHHLNELCLRLESDIRFSRVSRLLTLYAPCLKKLKLVRHPFKNCEPFAIFPCSVNLNALTHLDLRGSVCKNLDVLLLTPALEFLKVDAVCYKQVPCVNYNDGTDPKWHCKNTFLIREDCMHISQQTSEYYSVCLEDLILNSSRLRNETSFSLLSLHNVTINQILSTETLKVLHGFAPNIESFQLICKSSGFMVLCHQWLQLRRLDLLYGSCVEDNDIINMFSNLKLEHTRLQHFSLENTCHQNPITDVGAMAFLKIKQLKTLKIQYTQMSTNCVEILQGKIPNFQTNHLGNIHKTGDDFDCCRKLQFHKQIGMLI